MDLSLMEHICDDSSQCQICIAYMNNLIPSPDGLYKYEEENEEFMKVNYQT